MDITCINNIENQIFRNLSLSFEILPHGNNIPLIIICKLARIFSNVGVVVTFFLVRSQFDVSFNGRKSFGEYHRLKEETHYSVFSCN